MIRRIAIVEDNPKDLKVLQEHIEHFSKTEKVQCAVTVYKDGIDLLSKYSADFDVLFIDIEMPLLNGMDAARKLREIDKDVCIMFVTNMAQYAVEGYEVNALDFMLKPVGYFNFARKLVKAFNYADMRREKEIIITREEGLVKLPVSKIFYIEKDKNYIVYHTGLGVYRIRGTMHEMEESLKGQGFGKCISGCLVNMKHIDKTTPTSVFIAGEEIPISRNQRKDFVNGLMSFFAGGGC